MSFKFLQLWISLKRLFVNCKASRDSWVVVALVELRRAEAVLTEFRNRVFC
jgi:hypothetical protein